MLTFFLSQEPLQLGFRNLVLKLDMTKRVSASCLSVPLFVHFFFLSNLEILGMTRGYIVFVFSVYICVCVCVCVCVCELFFCQIFLRNH